MKKECLIVYYTCGGLTRKVATCIKEKTNGDIFEIELLKPYNKLTAYTIGMVHTHTGHLPEIKNKIDISKYDTVFLGTPIWAYTLTPALRSFINQYSLDGKRVIPFCTDGGNKGKYFEDLKKLCNEVEVSLGHEFQFVNKKKDDELQKEVNQWIDIVLK